MPLCPYNRPHGSAPVQMEMPPAPQAMLPVTGDRLRGERTAKHSEAAPDPPVFAKSPAISPGVPLHPGNAPDHKATPLFLAFGFVQKKRHLFQFHFTTHP